LVEYANEKQDLNLCNGVGETALILAAWNNHVPCVLFLLNYGVDINIQDLESGWSALHHACYRGSLVTISALLAFGARTDLKDHMGDLALNLVPLSSWREHHITLSRVQKHYLECNQSHSTNLLSPLDHKISSLANSNTTINPNPGGNDYKSLVPNLYQSTSDPQSLKRFPEETKFSLSDSDSDSDSDSGPYKSSYSSPPRRTDNKLLSLDSDSSDEEFLLSEPNQNPLRGSDASSQPDRPQYLSENHHDIQYLEDHEEEDEDEEKEGTYQQIAANKSFQTQRMLWSCGEASDLQLGYVCELSRSFPSLVGGQLATEDITDSACSDFGSVAVTGDGKVFSWGRGAGGRLGHAEAQDEILPRLLNNLVERKQYISKIICHKYTTAAINNRGRVYVWGRIPFQPPKATTGVSGDAQTSPSPGAKSLNSNKSGLHDNVVTTPLRIDMFPSIEKLNSHLSLSPLQKKRPSQERKLSFNQALYSQPQFHLHIKQVSLSCRGMGFVTDGGQVFVLGPSVRGHAFYEQPKHILQEIAGGIRQIALLETGDLCFLTCGGHIFQQNQG